MPLPEEAECNLSFTTSTPAAANRTALCLHLRRNSFLVTPSTLIAAIPREI